MTLTTYSEDKMGERYPYIQVKTAIWTHFPIELNSERGIFRCNEDQVNWRFVYILISMSESRIKATYILESRVGKIKMCRESCDTRVTNHVTPG